MLHRGRGAKAGAAWKLLGGIEYFTAEVEQIESGLRAAVEESMDAICNPRLGREGTSKFYLMVRPTGDDVDEKLRLSPQLFHLVQLL